MASTYDIAVAWRIYPGVSKTPLIHANDKLKLVTACLHSFIECTEGLRVSYYFLLDNCPPEYRTQIEGLTAGYDVHFIELPGVGNLASFAKQVEILLAQQDAELVYFAEDDYLYQPGQFHRLVAFIRSGKADFVSAYAHADLFSHPIHDHPRKTEFAFETLWLGASSTCLTFLTTKNILRKTAPVFLTYARGNNDCALWLVLTKTHIWNPVAWFRYLHDPRCAGILKVAVKRSFRFFFSFNRYTLYVPFPSVGTHLEKEGLSPGTDWLALADSLDRSA